MDQANIAPIITAVGILVTALTALIAILRQGPKLDAINPKLDTIKEQTNSTLTHLQTKADTAADQRATPAELAARLQPPQPPIPLNTIKPPT